MGEVLPASIQPVNRFSPATGLLCLVVLVCLCAGCFFAARIDAQTPDASTGISQSIRDAEDALRQGETQLAESRYRDALQGAWMLLGAGYAADANWSAAREAFERAGRQALELRRPVLALASADLRLGDSDAALKLLSRLQSRFPSDLEIRRLLAQALSAAGKEAEAVEELAEAHAESPEDLELTFSLATGRLKLGQVEEAAELFAVVAAARPIPETYVLIGRTYRDLQHYEHARGALRQAIELDPDVRKARFYLGTVELLDEGRGALGVASEFFRDELALVPDDPLSHLFLGLALVEERHFAEAVPHLELAADTTPTRLDALHFLGRALLGLNRAPEAVEPLQEAVTLAQQPGRDVSPNQRASLHYQLAIALRRTGRPDEAAAHFEAAEAELEDLTDESRERLRRYLEDAPDEPKSLTVAVPTLGTESLTPEQRTSQRRSLFDLVARADLNLGILQARAGRHDRAAGFFRLASDAAVDSELAAQARYSLGVALFNAGRPGEALEPLESAWAVGRDAGETPDPTLRRMLALTRLETEHWQGAADLLAQDPELASDPSLLFAYGTALVRSGHADEALAVFDSLADAEKGRPQLAVLFAQAYAQQGDWASAEESLRRALELDPSVAAAHSTLGEIYLRTGRLDEAAKELQAELALHPADRRSHFLLATVLDLLDRHDEAETQVRWVLEQQPDNADARYLLGKILLAAGRLEDAASQLESAARLAPGDANVHYQLAQAYQRLGRRDASREQFYIYRELKAKSRDQVGELTPENEPENEP